MNWYVAETISTQEARAVEQLGKQGFRAIYPKLVVRRPLRRRGPEIEVVRPLFPRYIFVWLDLGRDRWRAVNGTLGVRRLFGGEEPTPLRGDDVLRLVERCDAGPLVEDEFAALVAGAHVRVEEGVLIGHTGRIVSREGNGAKGRVAVLMELLGRPMIISLPTGAVSVLS